MPTSSLPLPHQNFAEAIEVNTGETVKVLILVDLVDFNEARQLNRLTNEACLTVSGFYPDNLSSRLHL